MSFAANTVPHNSILYINTIYDYTVYFLRQVSQSHSATRLRHPAYFCILRVSPAGFYGFPTIQQSSAERALLRNAYSRLSVALQIDYLCGGEFVEAVLSVSATYTRLTPPSVEALHCLEMFAVDVSLSEI